MRRPLPLPTLLLVLSLHACAHPRPAPTTAVAEPAPPPLAWEPPAAPPRPISTAPLALVGGTVLTAAGPPIERGVVLMRDGLIEAVGPAGEVPLPRGVTVIDVGGRVVTPGLIDTHSHMGVYPVPAARAHLDGNEASAPVTAHVRAFDSFWPQDPALPKALAGGVTTIQVLPGSANLIGGQGAIMKLRPGRSASAMAFPGAPATLKMACGENPKRVHGENRKTAPSTRMGNVAGYRAAYQAALEYGQKLREWQGKHMLWQTKKAKFDEARAKAQHTAAAHGPDATAGRGPRGQSSAGKRPDDPGPAPVQPARDFGLETLLGAIEGRVLVQMHCYRADEMVRMMELAREMGFRVRSFHHAVEAYKIRDLLVREDVGISTWSDWWGFKLEAFDAIPENLGLLSEAGVRAVLHSDDNMFVQRLNQEAAKAMHSARASGVEVSEATALSWITTNPAWVLGIEDRVGSLEPGKMADVVVWSGTPFSVYTRVDQVYVDGQLAFDRAHGPRGRRSDFELGIEPEVP